MKASKIEKYVWAAIIFSLIVWCIFGCEPASAQSYSQKKAVVKQYDLSVDVPKEVPITIVKVMDYVLEHEITILFKDTKKNIIHAAYEQETDALSGISLVFNGNNNDRQSIQIFENAIFYKYKGHFYQLIVVKVYE